MNLISLSRWLRAVGLALAILAGGVVNQAKADLRLTVNDGSVNQYYYFTPSNGGGFGQTAGILIDGYQIGDTLTSNFPGTVTNGNMQQSINITTTSSNLPTVSLTLDIVQTPVGLIVTDGNGLVTSGQGLVAGAALSQFTLPIGTLYSLLSSSSTTTNITVNPASTALGSSTFGSPAAMTLNNVSHTFNPNGADTVTQLVVGSGLGYTLSNRIVLTGFTMGVDGATVQQNTSVNTVLPEPATIAMFGTAIPFSLLYLKRRKAAKLAPTV